MYNKMSRTFQPFNLILPTVEIKLHQKIFNWECNSFWQVRKCTNVSFFVFFPSLCSYSTFCLNKWNTCTHHLYLKFYKNKIIELKFHFLFISSLRNNPFPTKIFFLVLWSEMCNLLHAKSFFMHKTFLVKNCT